MRAPVLLVVASLALACNPSLEAPDTDPCEEAARHRETCTGDYVTPPFCDPAAAARAESILAMDCTQVSALEADPGKADGAFCDWFGVGCTPDEAIFEGPACEDDGDCSDGFCVESHCFSGVGSAEMAAILDTWTGTTEDTGSYTRLLVDNAETRALRRQLIESAQHSLHFSAFIIEDDTVGAEMVELFSAAAQRGVEVRVVVDASTQYTFSSYDLLFAMRDAGVQIIPFNAVTEWADVRLGRSLTANDRLHEKMLIVDGAEAVMGGRNVGEGYLLDGRWRDTDVHVIGPGVNGIQRMFLGFWDRNAAWELEAGCPNEAAYGFHCPEGAPLSEDAAYYNALGPVAGGLTRPVYSDPTAQDTPHGYLTTLALIRSARESIEIANSYFVPPRRMRTHLKAAAARGVKVTVLTNSKESTDAWWMYYASINYYEELIRAGIEIRQYHGTETMHSKTMLVDGELAVIGSFNLDPRSAVDNSESMLLVREGAAVGELGEAFEVDFAYSDVASYDLPASELVKARAFRLVEPLL